MISTKVMTAVLGSLLLGAATMAQAQVPGIEVAPGFPAPGATSSGESGFGGWTSNQLRGVLDTLPYGSPSQSHVGLAIWEYFPTGVFSQLAPQYWGTGAALNAELDQIISPTAWSGTVVPVNGLGGRLHDSSLDFGIYASAAEELVSISVTLKHTRYVINWDTLPEDAQPFANMVLDLDGVEHLPTINLDYEGVYYSASEPGTTLKFFISTFTWNVSVGAAEEFAIYFSNPADYFSIDSIALHTQGIEQIPEPGTYALMGAGALLLARWHRRRGQRSRSL